MKALPRCPCSTKNRPLATRHSTLPTPIQCRRRSPCMSADAKPLPIHIVGVGDDGLGGLTESARSIVAEAALLAGPPRALEAAGGSAEKLPFTSDLEASVRRIDQESQKRKV